MRTRIYAIKDHRIVSTIDIAPFSVKEMSKLCKEQNFDNWFYLDKDGAMKLLQIDEEDIEPSLIENADGDKELL